ncbi:unnamed protein product [Rangifer tarandus platyrhynchus]|uniref:Uncharacterized protein n=1 Tax=Rangifer tarandus platyrhynchus TaxID=3082113 RepID=A0AC59YKV1_RANTA
MFVQRKLHSRHELCRQLAPPGWQLWGCCDVVAMADIKAGLESLPSLLERSCLWFPAHRDRGVGLAYHPLAPVITLAR